MLEWFYENSIGDIGPRDIVRQLEFVARSHRRRLLLVIASDDPDISSALDDVLKTLNGRHELIWLMIENMPAVGSMDGEQDGFDVATGRFALGGAVLGPRVIAAYKAA
nr:hypothetical protein [Mycobacterium lepraemurium]